MEIYFLLDFEERYLNNMFDNSECINQVNSWQLDNWAISIFQP